MQDNRKPYNFKSRKDYEETFINNNKGLILDLTGGSELINLSEQPLDVLSGIDALIQIGRKLHGIALRIRSPKYYKYRYNFTIGHHISKANSQIHSIMNSLHPTEVYYPHFIIQVNGVDQKGYCEDCVAIRIQTNIWAERTKELNETNELENYYMNNLGSYEFGFKDAWYQTDTGVDYFEIKNNTIIKRISND